MNAAARQTRQPSALDHLESSALGFLPWMPAEQTRGRRAAASVAVAPPTEPVSGLSLSVDRISSASDFEAVSIPASDLISNGRIAKFLIDRRDATNPVARFINGNFTEGGVVPESARFHYMFALTVLGIAESLQEFNAVTYFTNDKRYVAGVVHSYFLDGSTDPIYGLQFYPQDVINEGAIIEALRVVKDQIAIADSRFAFVPTGTQQTTATVAAELADVGLELLPLDQILGTIDYIPLNLGEAWGFLRIFPASNDDLRPTDIPVFDELPLDLSVVAGVLTRAVQDTNSHVNLKSKERHTPNAVLRSAGPDNARLAPYADKPVHLIVARDDFVLEETTEEMVAQKLAERMSQPLISLSWEPESELRSYDELAKTSRTNALAAARRYGSKAANLGFLAHRLVLGRVADAGSPSAMKGYDLVPQGFAVPLAAYADFVSHPPNTDLRAKLADLIDSENGGALSPRERADKVNQVQAAFLAAEFPEDALRRLRTKLAEALPGVKKIKVRSSANAEDVPNFDGAGLHDSFAADTDKDDLPDCGCRVSESSDGGEVKRKVKPKSVLCAVKGVYASLWNKRAIEERSFARIDHSSVAMGLAIVPAYDLDSDVAANAVVVTRVLNTNDVYGYSLSLQLGNNLVTNPDPGTYSEVTIAGFISETEPVSLTITRFAKPTRESPERTESVLTREQMLDLVDLARRVENAYCAAKRDYYPGPCEFVTVDNQKPKSLDLEVKLLENRQWVVKQVREFGGS
jgi:Pyruvate phosphate dikinase, AMP/ATP-binding domain